VAGKFTNYLFTWAERFVRVAAENEKEAGKIARDHGFDLLVEKGKCERLDMSWNTPAKGLVSSSREG
jgi:hypothetical protein